MDNQKPIRPGDSAKITRDYFDSLLIEMRHIDNVLPSTKFEAFGLSFDTPITMAAFSHLSAFGFHENGMVEVAKAAKALNALNFAGMGSTQELESIIATGAATVKIEFKPYADNERIIKKLEHAERAGAVAVGMDIDHSFNRTGEYDNIRGDAMLPKSFDELKLFVKLTKLPFIVKGVLSVQDALKCADAGAQGIVVSHHHGIIDYAVAPLMILPKIVEAVGGKMSIFVDCGVETGYDAFKALGLGASAVSVGRAVLEPLKKEGAEGIRKYVERMTLELAGVMARTGSQDIQTIDPTVIWKGKL